MLDEISSVRDWQKAIKRLWDQALLKNCSVIATGSHTLDMRMSSERLPGRRGEINDAMDKVMHPMKFFDYVKARERGAAREIPGLYVGDADQSRDREKILAGIMPERLAGMQPDALDRLNDYLLDYMLTGGIPRIVEAGLRRASVDEHVYERYLSTFLADLERVEKSQRIVRDLARGIIDLGMWPVSWTSLMKRSGMGDAGTVPRYIELLENMFVVSVLYQYDSKRKRAVPQKDKKIHFVDPFYLHLFNGWTRGVEAYYGATRLLADRTSQGHVAEGIVANHLIRMAFERSPKKPWFDHTLYLHFWKYGPDKEVDFVYNDAYGVELPIEVKFRERLNRRDLDGIIRFKKATGAKNGIVLTRDDLSSESECIKVPVAAFLLLA